MACHAPPAVQALHGGGGETNIELSAHQGVGDGVVVPVDLDVVVDVDPDLLPLGEHVALGGQRAKCRTLKLLEHRAPRPRELAERALVEPFQQPGDGGVELGERAVTQRGQDPALHDLHGDLHLRLVARAPCPGGQHRHAVVAGQVVVGRVDVRLVAMGAAHGRAQIVWNDQFRTAPEELERANVRCRPVREGLGPGRLGEGVA